MDVLEIKQIEIYCDGGCSNSHLIGLDLGGIGTWAFVIKSVDDSGVSQVVSFGYGCLGVGHTNNYVGLIAIQKALIILNATLNKYRNLDQKITVYSDSQIGIRMINGELTPKSGKFFEVVNQIKTLGNQLSKAQLIFDWIPRFKNKEADKLASNSLAVYKDNGFKVFETFKEGDGKSLVEFINKTEEKTYWHNGKQRKIRLNKNKSVGKKVTVESSPKRRNRNKKAVKEAGNLKTGRKYKKQVVYPKRGKDPLVDKWIDEL